MMDLETLAESFTSVLNEEWPREAALAYSASHMDERDKLWKTVAELGWAALAAPEPHGGLGLGLDAAACLQMALGQSVAPLPLSGTALATHLLIAAGTQAQQRTWLPPLVAGSVRATIQIDMGETDLPILENGLLNGRLLDVVDAPSAELLIFRVQHGQSAPWVILDMRFADLPWDEAQFADVTRTVASLDFDDFPLSESQIIEPAYAEALRTSLLRSACVLLAADSVGVGEAVLAGTVEYLKTREQFGKLIGSFQALKHRVADHQAALVGARELVIHAARSEDDSTDSLLLALAAKVHVTHVVAEVARDCIQLFGGVGYTTEYFPHLYLKRAKLNEALIGQSVDLLDRIADILEAA